MSPLHLLISFFFLFLIPSHGLTMDGTLLLSFKYSILSDPLSVLANWDYNDPNPCLWTGVTCQTFPGNSTMPTVIKLSLPSSQLFGIIPEDLGFIPHLRTLDLSNNFFNGTLPRSLFNATELQVLSLSNNSVSGTIPDLLPNCGLKIVNLSGNALSGNVPKGITSLSEVYLRSNYLSGPVPGEVKSLQFLDLSSNLLNGSLPADFNGENLNYLNLSSNELSGSVPPQFASQIPGNATIDLSFNALSGKIPESLVNQKSEAFAGNADLCGKPLKKLCTIPSTLSNPMPDSLNTSSPAIAAIPNPIPLPNNATGTPTSPVDHGMKPAVIAGVTVAPLAGLGLLAIVFMYAYQKRRSDQGDNTEKCGTKSTNMHGYMRDSEEPSTAIKDHKTLPVWPCFNTTNGEESTDSNENSNHTTDHHINQLKNERSLVMVDGETQLELETLFKASAYVLGSSGASIVYKAVFQDGTAFAVRRIGESSAIYRLKEFENQVKAIAKFQHQNLVRIRGFYWGCNEKLVIYDYVSNGSLANVGYRKLGSSPLHLSFEARLKIAKGVAQGLHYVHGKKSVHCNIKPSNILLTPDMDPVISDFGLHWLMHGKHGCKPDGTARHFGSYRSMSHHDDYHDQQVNSNPYIAPAGFIGCTSPYHAPESLKKLKPSPKWDVYSFGILLLELLTGKVFSDRELSQWRDGSVGEDPSRVVRMAGMAIRGDMVGQEAAIVAWFKLGLSCASLAPQKRPSMKDVVNVLEKLPNCC